MVEQPRSYPALVEQLTNGPIPSYLNERGNWVLGALPMSTLDALRTNDAEIWSRFVDITRPHLIVPVEKRWERILPKDGLTFAMDKAYGKYRQALGRTHDEFGPDSDEYGRFSMTSYRFIEVTLGHCMIREYERHRRELRQSAGTLSIDQPGGSDMDAALEIPVTNECPEQLVGTRLLIAQALAQLPEQTRLIFQMMQSHTREEIATELGVSLSYVKKKISRTREELSWLRDELGYEG